MDYEWCRINELVRHAASGDAKAQGLLIEEIRSYLNDLLERYGAACKTTYDFAQQVLARARLDYQDFWAQDPEFSRWLDGILQTEVEEACRCARRG